MGKDPTLLLSDKCDITCMCKVEGDKKLAYGNVQGKLHIFDIANKNE